METSIHPFSTARPVKRVKGWRALLLLAAVACAVSLYSIEATHNHQTVLDDLRCPVCHVVGHNALDVYTPDLSATIAVPLVLFLGLPRLAAGLPRRGFFPKPRSRAPPSSVSSSI